MNNNRRYSTFSLISINILELNDALEDFLCELDKQLIEGYTYTNSHFTLDSLSWSISKQGGDYWRRLRGIEQLSLLQIKRIPIYLKNFTP